MRVRLTMPTSVGGPGQGRATAATTGDRSFFTYQRNRSRLLGVVRVGAERAVGVPGRTDDRAAARGCRGSRAMDIMSDGPVLVLVGDFDVRSTFQVRNALYDRLASFDDVVVDLSEVDAVDMTALKVLAAATRQTAREGRHLTLRGCTPAVRRMLHLTRLARVVEVERGRASA